MAITGMGLISRATSISWAALRRGRAKMSFRNLGPKGGLHLFQRNCMPVHSSLEQFRAGESLSETDRTGSVALGNTASGIYLELADEIKSAVLYCAIGTPFRQRRGWNFFVPNLFPLVK